VNDLKTELEEERESSRNTIEKLTAEIEALQLKVPVKDYSDDLRKASKEITELLVIISIVDVILLILILCYYKLINLAPRLKMVH
jgi:hypothetical protein